MSERYSRLFSLSENLYAEGAPVLIAAGALLKDNETGKVLAQIKIRNIGPKAIKAATVSILPLDVVGSPLGNVVEYQYLDLNAARDNEFGQKTAVSLPDASTRAYSVIVSQVIFSDNSIWHDSGVVWEPLVKQQTLAKVFNDNELVKQYKLKYGSNCDYVFQEEKDLWMCSCGGVNRNTESQCHSCGTEIDALNSFDLNTLKSVCAARLAAERKLTEKEHAAAAAKAKKTKRIVSIVAPILIIAVVAGVLIINTVQKKQQELAAAAAKEETYNDAIELMNSGNAVEAYELFSLLGDYKDANTYFLVEIAEVLTKEDVSLLASDSSVVEEYSVKYVYDSQGRLISKSSGRDFEGTTNYHYDDFGVLINSTGTEAWSRKSNGYTRDFTNEYNEYGDIVKETFVYNSPDNWTYTNGEKVVYENLIEYNSQGQKVFQTVYEDGELYCIYSYTNKYNSSGEISEIVEKIEYYGFSLEIIRTTKNYFDSSGKLTMYEVYEDGVKTKVVVCSYSTIYRLDKQ